MKKFGKLILGFLLIIPFAFAITACGSEPELEKIVAIVNNGNFTVYEYQDFTITDIDVKAIYSDKTQKTLESGDYIVTINNSVTNPEVYVSYQGKKVTIALHTEKLQSIRFAKTKLTLQGGEEIDYSSLKLKALYANGHEETISCNQENVTLTNTDLQGVQNLTYDFHGKTATIKVETLPTFATTTKGETLETKEPFVLEQVDNLLNDGNDCYNLDNLKAYYNLAVTYNNKDFITEGIVFPEISYLEFEKGLRTIKPYYITENGTKIECPIQINIAVIDSFNLIQNATPIYVGDMVDIMEFFTLEFIYEKWNTKTNTFVKETKPCDITDFISNFDYEGFAELEGINSLGITFKTVNNKTPITKTITYNAIVAKIIGLTLENSNIVLFQYQTFSLSDIIFYYTYESINKAPELVDPARMSFLVSSIDTSTAGIIEVTATCTDEENWVEGASKSLTFNIEVVEVNSISASLCEGMEIFAGEEINASYFDILVNDIDLLTNTEDVVITPNVANVESGQTLEIEISYHGIKTMVSVVIQ